MTLETTETIEATQEAGSEEPDYAGLVANESAPNSPPSTGNAPEVTEKGDEDPPVTNADGDTQPVDGTKDKALQKVQQQVSAIDSRLEKLLQVAENRDLTPKEIAKVQDLKEERDEIADLLGRDDSDFIDPANTKALAKRILSIEKASKERIDSLEKELKAARGETQKVAAETAWERQAQTHHVPISLCQDVWKESSLKAESEVLEEVEGEGLSEAQIVRLCFKRTQRIYDVSMPQAAKKAKDAPPKTAPKTAPKTTPGGARVTASNRSPASEPAFDPHNPARIGPADYAGLMKQSD